MRKAAEIKPRDVSKGLFMDLAFLLIAGLVLLVQEPAEQRKFDIAFLETTRRTRVNKVEEKDLPGESLFLEALPSGKVFEVLYNGKRKELGVEQFPERIDQMSQKGERVVVLYINPDTPYAKISTALDEITKMQQERKISKVYEIVRKD